MKTSARDRRALSGACLLVIGLARSAAAVDDPPALVRILEPAAGVALLGPQRVRVEVVTQQAVRAVEIYLDDRLAATLVEPPYSVVVDTGDENRGHRLEAVAHLVSGASGRAVVDVPALAIHERVDLELMQVYLTATRQERRVTDLQVAELAVFDDRVKQPIVTFESGDLPFTAVLLLDASASMAGDRLRTALAGAQAFVRGMAPLDHARLLVVSDRVLAVSPFVDRGETLIEVLAETATGGGTVLHDHLFLALHSVEQRQGRPVVVLLSDGLDTHSVLSMAEVREVALSGRAQLYWLKLSGAGDGAPPMPRTAWRSPAAASDSFELLARTVGESGGRILEVERVDSVVEAFREVLRELREQYAIGYYPEPPGPTGGWRTVRVEVARRGLALRYRQGYYDD